MHSIFRGNKVVRRSLKNIVETGRFFYNKPEGCLEEVENIVIDSKKTLAYLTIKTKFGTTSRKTLRIAAHNPKYFVEGESPTYLYETVENFMIDVHSYIDKCYKTAQEYQKRYLDKLDHIEAASLVSKSVCDMYPEEII